MLESPHRETIERIHASGRSGVVAVTGGGSLVISDLLTVAGASRSMLEALVPYSFASLVAFLGAAPAHACRQHTARAMAMAAFWRAIRWRSAAPSGSTISTWSTVVSDPVAESVWGVACTASLASDRPKRGDHRFHVAAQTADRTWAWSAVLQKGIRTRAEEERLVADFLIAAIAQACSLTGVEAPTLEAPESLEGTSVEARPEWRRVVLGQANAVRIGSASDSTSASSSVNRVLLPGAFHPLHEGHRHIAQWASRYLNRPVEFELSVRNVDKPPLDYVEIAERFGQFDANQVVWLTNAPTFVEKARIFPGATFLVGVDTLIRIGDPRYYGSEDACQAALKELEQHNCSFLVFGRLVGDRFLTLRDLPVPDLLRRRCQEVPADEFRCDLSSTQIRAEQHIMEE